MKKIITLSLITYFSISACAYAQTIATFPVSLQLYKIHAPFEHNQYSISGGRAKSKKLLDSHFKSKGWEKISSISNSNNDFEFNRQAYELMSSLLSDRLPYLRQRDLRGDKKVIKKWRRTQLWKDWSEAPAFVENYRSGTTVDCASFTSPEIKGSVQGMANSFKDLLHVCFQSDGSDVVKVGIRANTLHLIDDRFQVGSGDIGILWLPWLDGTRLASELAELNFALTTNQSASSGSPKLPPSASYLRSGSGFFVSQRAVITNHHVINGCNKIFIAGMDRAALVAEDETNDLAVIFSKQPNDTYLRLTDMRVVLGEDVSVFGYPLQQVLSPTIHMTKGNVSSLAGLSGNTALFQMTAPIQPGNSGGPVVNASGSVSGIATSTLSPQFAMRELGSLPQGVNFAVRASLVSNLMDIYGIEVGESPASLGTNTKAQAAVVKIECRE
jgi:S1-C subfamily serine protease